MHIELTATKPREHNYTMTATMSLKDWMEIRKEMEDSNRSPIWEFRRAIDKAVGEAEEVYRADVIRNPVGGTAL